MSESAPYLMPWAGGKMLLRRFIADYIPRERFRRWVEPFGGSGSMLFYRQRWGTEEVYNDIDNRLYNLFLIVKYHPQEFYRQFKWGISSAAEWFDYFNSVPLTDIQRAARFFYVVSMSFGGKGTSPAYGSFTKTCITADLGQIHQRVQRVNIENRDYEYILNRYDGAQTFFYLDPPYDGSTIRYRSERKTKFDQTALRDAAANLKGRWLMSNADTPLIRSLYKDFRIVSFERHIPLTNDGSGKKKRFSEVLIANYDLEAVKTNTPLFENETDYV